jgi:hypothetical protein
MRQRTVKLWKILALLGGGGMLLQATAVGFTRTGLGGFSCQSERFASNGLASSVDFCYLLNCDQGFLGGVVKPCDPGNPANNILLDCPGAITTNTTGTNAQQTTTP